ncbi:MAG: lytic transglycosylase domain-containing protein [Candidatus Wallbacteria bacterium]|nr:lytic transglycosylase domain-containing protein [Candidatus Wallbacteria bacterium]
MIENVQTVMNRILELRSKFQELKKTPAGKSISAADNDEKKTDGHSFAEVLENKTRTASRDEILQKIELYCKAEGVDPDLINAVVSVESSFDPEAVSGKGATGLMQLMPKTASELGVKDLTDIDDNLKGGISYLSGLLSRYGGDLEKALAAYNAGPTSVDRHNGVPPIKETKDYVRKVLERYSK